MWSNTKSMIQSRHWFSSDDFTIPWWRPDLLSYTSINRMTCTCFRSVLLFEHGSHNFVVVHIGNRDKFVQKRRQEKQGPFMAQEGTFVNLLSAWTLQNSLFLSRETFSLMMMMMMMMVRHWPLELYPTILSQLAPYHPSRHALNPLNFLTNLPFHPQTKFTSPDFVRFSGPYALPISFLINKFSCITLYFEIILFSLLLCDIVYVSLSLIK